MEIGSFVFFFSRFVVRTSRFRGVRACWNLPFEGGTSREHRASREESSLEASVMWKIGGYYW